MYPFSSIQWLVHQSFLHLVEIQQVNIIVFIPNRMSCINLHQNAKYRHWFENSSWYRTFQVTIVHIHWFSHSNHEIEIYSDVRIILYFNIFDEVSNSILKLRVLSKNVSVSVWKWSVFGARRGDIVSILWFIILFTVMSKTLQQLLLKSSFYFINVSMFSFEYWKNVLDYDWKRTMNKQKKASKCIFDILIKVRNQVWPIELFIIYNCRHSYLIHVDDSNRISFFLFSFLNKHQSKQNIDLLSSYYWSSIHCTWKQQYSHDWS